MHSADLPQALAGDPVAFGSAGTGRLAGFVAGRGAPLLLVHSVNAAASVAELRPLHEHFRATRRVLSFDLPGYGRSDRGARRYTPRLMTDAVHEATELLRAQAGGARVDALALSLGCEFLARAAAERPEDYRSLALVSPTGFNGRAPRRAAPGTTREMRWLGAVLRGPGWGGALFRGLTKPGVVRYFLRRTFGRDEIDEAMWADAVATARAPGAEHAPLAFLSGALFSADIHAVYDRLAMPVWMCHGVRGDFTDYRGKAFVEAKPNWRFRVFDSGALPYFERPGEFVAAYAQFLAAAG